MAGMPWIKIYTEMLDDVKMSRLTDAQKWRFVQLIIMAGECDACGDLVTGDSRMTHEDVTWRLRCDSQILESDISKLIECGLISRVDGVVSVIKFSERQGPTQENKREVWRKRQETHRNKANKENVTGDSRMSHATEEEKRREEEEAAVTSPFSLMSSMIATKLKIPEFTGGVPKWEKAVSSILAVEPLESDIDKAIEYMADKSIAGPWSILNPIIIAKGQRERGSNGNGKHPRPGKPLEGF